MRMQFGADEHDAFHECAGRLVGGFAEWLDENDLVAEPTSAELLLQYKWLAADGDLADWPLEHVETFLDGWCPKVMAEHRLPARLVPLTVAVFLEYLDECGLLTPASPRPSQVRRLCTAYADDYDALEAGPVHPVLTEFDTPPDPVRIPGPTERAASAAEARIVHDARALADWCGERGRALTRTGNLRLADARHLTELLATGDELPPSRTLARSDQLPTLTWVLETAVRAGAVHREGGRLVAAPRFATLDDTSAHEDLVLAARDVGVLTVSTPGRRHSADDAYELDDDLLGDLLGDAPDEPAEGPVAEEQDLEVLVRELAAREPGDVPHSADELLEEVLDEDDDLDLPEPADDATPTFLALLRHPDDGMGFDDLVELLDLVLGWNADFVHLDVAPRLARDLLGRLERLGLVRWTESTRDPDDHGGEEHRTGGRVTLTHGGVACALLVLAAEGLGFPSRPDPAVATVAEIVDLAGEVPPAEWRSDIDAWHAAQPDPGWAVAALGTRALAPEQPLVVVLTATSVAAERFGADVVDDLLHEHLDGPHRGQIARRLVARGRLDPLTVEPELLLHASVDVLAVTIDTIESTEWPALFAREFPPETVVVFDDVWRLDNPRLGDVLAEVGEHHPDRRVAKAARRARARWQSRTGGA